MNTQTNIAENGPCSSGFLIFKNQYASHGPCSIHQCSRAFDDFDMINTVFRNSDVMHIIPLLIANDGSVFTHLHTTEGHSPYHWLADTISYGNTINSRLQC